MMIIINIALIPKMWHISQMVHIRAQIPA